MLRTMKNRGFKCPAPPGTLITSCIAFFTLILMVLDPGSRSGGWGEGGSGGGGGNRFPPHISTHSLQSAGDADEVTPRRRSEEAKTAVKSCKMRSLKDIQDFFDYPDQNLYPCRNKTKMGGQEVKFGIRTLVDGDKWVCMDTVLGLEPQHCIVYSFGVNFDFSFDDAMARHGCKVWSFDPTMGVPDHQRSPNLTFLNLGLGRDQRTVEIMGVQAKVDRLGGIIKSLGHEGRRLDYLKLDIEGMEVEVLEQVVMQEPHLLTLVNQLAVEVHPHKYQGEDVTWSGNPYHKLYRLFHLLHCLGFQLFHWATNEHPGNVYKWNGTHRSACYEIVWVRVPT